MGTPPPTPLVFATYRGDKKGREPFKSSPLPLPGFAVENNGVPVGGRQGGSGVHALLSLGCLEKSRHGTLDCHP